MCKDVEPSKWGFKALNRGELTFLFHHRSGFLANKRATENERHKAHVSGRCTKGIEELKLNLVHFIEVMRKTMLYNNNNLFGSRRSDGGR